MPRPSRLFCLLAVLVPVLQAGWHGGPAAASSAGVQDSTGVETGKPPRKEGAPRAVFQIEEGGVFVIELMPGAAPKTVERIRGLIEEGFYDGKEFHRVESWLVQTGRTEEEYPVLEGEMFSQRIGHERGMVGMARLGNDYDSATTQFYILKERKPMLSGEYTIFGRVVEGMDVVDGIEQGDEIESCRIE